VFLKVFFHSKVSRKGLIYHLFLIFLLGRNDLGNLNIIIEVLALVLFEQWLHILVLEMGQLLSNRVSFFFFL
jgi:hypothetical protein